MLSFNAVTSAWKAFFTYAFVQPPASIRALQRAPTALHISGVNLVHFILTMWTLRVGSIAKNPHNSILSLPEWNIVFVISSWSSDTFESCLFLWCAPFGFAAAVASFASAFFCALAMPLSSMACAFARANCLCKIRFDLLVMTLGKTFLLLSCLHCLHLDTFRILLLALLHTLGSFCSGFCVSVHKLDAGCQLFPSCAINLHLNLGLCFCLCFCFCLW